MDLLRPTDLHLDVVLLLLIPTTEMDLHFVVLFHQCTILTIYHRPITDTDLLLLITLLITLITMLVVVDLLFLPGDHSFVPMRKAGASVDLTKVHPVSRFWSAMWHPMLRSTI